MPCLLRQLTTHMSKMQQNLLYSEWYKYLLPQEQPVQLMAISLFNEEYCVASLDASSRACCCPLATLACTGSAAFCTRNQSSKQLVFHRASLDSRQHVTSQQIKRNESEYI
jgi:hypothetical protein